MARPIPVAAGTGDVQAYTGRTRVSGYSAMETSGAAGASVVIRDGTSAAGGARILIGLAADASETRELPVVEFVDGIFVERVSGSTELVLYVG